MQSGEEREGTRKQGVRSQALAVPTTGRGQHQFHSPEPQPVRSKGVQNQLFFFKYKSSLFHLDHLCHSMKHDALCSEDQGRAVSCWGKNSGSCISEGACKA